MTDSCGKITPKTFPAKNGAYVEKFCTMQNGCEISVTHAYMVLNGVITSETFIDDDTGLPIVLPVGYATIKCAQRVKIVKDSCEKPELDRGFDVLCAPDGTKVIVQNVTPDDAPLGTAPTIEAWLLDSTPYAGLLADLGECGGEKVDVSAVQWFCLSGSSISRTDFWDVFSTPRALLGSVWQDASGAVIAAPVAGTYTVGACVSQTTSRPVCATMVNAEVWNVEERTDEAGNITYWDVDVSPMVDVTANVASILNGGECPCAAVAAPIDTPLTQTVQRLAVPYTVLTGYKSVSITAISSNVTIDAVPVPAGFNWSVDSSSGERFTDTVAITGTDYIVTEVR